MSWNFHARLLAAALLLASPAARAAGEPDAMRPVQMVRSLQLVQDRIAAGDHAAMPMQRKLLELIDARLLSGSAEELSEPANFRAALIYSMSGGNPRTLETVMSRLKLSEEDSRKAIGVLSYLTGGSKSALVALRSVDPLKEPPELGSFLALVKGSVASLEDPRMGLQLLDQARLLSPGTLVEEAALRRSIPLDVAIGDADRFILASQQYVRGFLRSPYASQFADAFVSGVVALHEKIDLKAVDDVVSMMTPEQQQVVYLRIARRSAIDGLTALSQFASSRTMIAGAPADAEDDPRALLYSSLASVATQPIDTLQQTLEKIDRTRLSPGDIKLLDAVSAVSRQMSELPDVAREDAPAPAAKVSEPLPAPAAPELGSPAPAVASAEPAPSDGARPVRVVGSQADALPHDGAIAPDPASAEPLPPIPETAQPLPGMAPDAQETAPAPATADTEATPDAAAQTAGADDPTPQDPSDLMVSEGRKKLEEIDQLLAKAVK